jgi:hypothetical protein
LDDRKALCLKATIDKRSFILNKTESSAFAELSTENTKPIKYTLGDMSGDGFVDAVDASAILAEYARLST